VDLGWLARATDDGRKRLVRHGHLPEREIMTGIGPVGVRCPRVRDRAGEGSQRNSLFLGDSAALRGPSAGRPADSYSAVLRTSAPWSRAEARGKRPAAGCAPARDTEAMRGEPNDANASAFVCSGCCTHAASPRWNLRCAISGHVKLSDCRVAFKQLPGREGEPLGSPLVSFSRGV
jgi:hypothetical protein